MKNEVYKHLQIIDILENKDNNHIQVKDIDKILYKIMKEYHLEYEKLIKYTKETNSKKALDKLITLAK